MSSVTTRVGRYRIERELVAEEDLRRWAAVDTLNDTPVEIVSPRAHVLLRPGAREEFEALRFTNDATLPVLASIEHEGTPMRVRPMTQGTLAGAQLSPDEALAVARWLIPAIREAGGAFGGELRPEDIAIDAGGVPRLAAIRLPRPERISRVPYHRAPEVFAGAEPTAASDLFGLGVTLYRAVAGVEPFPAESAAQLRLRTLPATPLSEHAAIPPELDQIVSALVSLDPEDRLAVQVPAIEAPPTIVLSKDHDAPCATRTVLATRNATTAIPPWLVVAPLAGLTPGKLRRVAVRSGVATEAVTAAAAAGLDWVLDTCETESEAQRSARRHQNRGLTAHVQTTAAPHVAQFLLLGLAAAGCWVFLPPPASWVALAVVALVVWRGAIRFRQGVTVARARYALSQRHRANAAPGAEGRAWTMEHRLREADHLPAPLRADLREALEAVIERLESLAERETDASVDGGQLAVEQTREIRSTRDELCRSLTRLEMEMTRTTAELSLEPDSPRASELGRLARAMRDGELA